VVSELGVAAHHYVNEIEAYLSGITLRHPTGDYMANEPVHRQLKSLRALITMMDASLSQKI
jgi:hypothetical protein